ncbi:MAG: hypothetical protein LAP21_16040 [Acidobacteriia bacterium]|nr:hypothetical protein [Terriglobia bacterium]
MAFVTSLFYFSHYHDFYETDSQTYIVPAANLLAGHGFTDADGYPETNRTPGYPLLILLFLRVNPDLKYLIVFQHLLRILIVLATTAFAFHLSGSRRQALLTGILLCIDLPMLKFTNSILTETVFTALLAATLWLLWAESEVSPKSGMRPGAAGLLSGLSALVRPVSIFFFVPAAAYILLIRRGSGLRAALSFLLAFLVLPLAWASRNYHESGYFTVASISGFSMLEYRAAGALAVNDPGDFEGNLEKRQKELEAGACEGLTNMYRRDCSKITIAQRADYYSHFGAHVVLHHPAAYLKLALRGGASMMLAGSAAIVSGLTGMNHGAAEKVVLMYTIPSFCLAIFGLMKWRAMNKAFFWLAALVITYFVAISAGAETNSRFRVPIMPIYAVLIATGMDAGIQRFIRRALPGE